jgi:hypothetical protein
MYVGMRVCDCMCESIYHRDIGLHLWILFSMYVCIHAQQISLHNVVECNSLHNTSLEAGAHTHIQTRYPHLRRLYLKTKKEFLYVEQAEKNVFLRRTNTYTWAYIYMCISSTHTHTHTHTYAHTCTTSTCAHQRSFCDVVIQHLAVANYSRRAHRIEIRVASDLGIDKPGHVCVCVCMFVCI